MSEKPLLRAELRRRRTAFHHDSGPEAAAAAAENFLSAFAPEPGTEVAVYWPYGTEIDPMPLADRLAEHGAKLSLPVVMAEHNPLVFRRWMPGDETVEGHYGIPSPPGSAEAVTPQVLVVPILGFTRDLFRLGYGGGFYDRTLEQLAAGGAMKAIGFAYAVQECELDAEKHDWRLDAVVTEKGVFRSVGAT